MESQQKAYEAFIKTHGMNLFSRDDETIAKRSFEAGYNAASPLSALNELQAATPAPLADAELAELAQLLSVANEGPFFLNKGLEKIWIENAPENGIVIAECALGHKRGYSNAQLICAGLNALPGLLARLVAAEDFKAQVVEVLDERRELAFADFTANVEDSTCEPIPGAEAGEEINKIIQLLGLAMPAQTVKGGQPRA